MGYSKHEFLTIYMFYAPNKNFSYYTPTSPQQRPLSCVPIVERFDYVYQEPMIPPRLLVCHVLIWSLWCHLWLEMAKLQRDCNAAFIAYWRQQFVPFLCQSMILGAQIVFLPLSPYFNFLSSFSSLVHYRLLLSPANLRNLQDVITYALHVCRQYSFGLPLRMNEMHITQFDHARLDLLLLVIWSRVFWPSVTWNVRKAQRWSKSVLTFYRCSACTL